MSVFRICAAVIEITLNTQVDRHKMNLSITDIVGGLNLGYLPNNGNIQFEYLPEFAALHWNQASEGEEFKW